MMTTEKDQELDKIIQTIDTAVKWANTASDVLEDGPGKNDLAKCNTLLQFCLSGIEDAVQMIDDQIEAEEYQEKAISENNNLWEMPGEELPGYWRWVPDPTNSTKTSVPTMPVADIAHEDNVNKINQWLVETDMEMKALKDKVEKIKQLRMEQNQDPKNRQLNKGIIGPLDPDTGDLDIDE